MTKADRRRVVDLIKQEYANAKNTLGGSGLVAVVAPNLQGGMNAVARVMDTSRALELGEPTYSDIVGDIV